MSYMEAAFAPVEAMYREQVQQATWGHLAPIPRRTYRGTILFVHGDYGDITPIRVRFPDLPDSPWFFEGMIEFLSSRRTRPGTVYLFSGSYMQCKNGAHRFSGKVRVVNQPTSTGPDGRLRARVGAGAGSRRISS